MPRFEPTVLSPLEFHVLLALADGPLYGYAMAQTIHDESGGALAPRAGSLYRLIARLMGDGLIREAAPESVAPHPGLDRRHYALTSNGQRTLAVEAQRLKRATSVAAKRLGIAPGQ